MKLIILQEKLKEGIKTTERISPKSLTLPILNTVLFQTEKNFLNLSATDLEIGINWWALAKIEKEGRVAIPFSILSDFLNLLPNKPIKIYQKENTLLVECEPYKTQIKGLSPEDFPIIPQIQKESFIEMESASLCQGLEQIVDIASFSQARPEISGIYFTIQDDSIKMAATDSFRLGEKTIFLEKGSLSPGNLKSEISFIVPQKTAREIINIFGQKNRKIKIYFSPNQVLIESQMAETNHPEVQIFSKLIDGEYPAYQEIIPQKNETQVVLGKSEFLNHLKTAALFSGRINEVKLKVEAKKNGIEFFSQNPDLGEHQSFLPGKIKGPSLDISFNHRFLAFGLSAVKSSEVIFELNKEEGPALLKPVGDPSYLYVVMPIKTT